MKNENHEILKAFKVKELEDRFEMKDWFRTPVEVPEIPSYPN